MDDRRWAALLDDTSKDTCSSSFTLSHSLFFGSVEDDGGGQGVNGSRGGKRRGVTQITDTDWWRERNGQNRCTESLTVKETF